MRREEKLFGHFEKEKILHPAGLSLVQENYDRV
mgnify:CR=1 FL=1